jgi:hypothetical protein
MGTRYLSKGSEMETRGPMSQSRFGADHGLAQRVSHSSRPNVARYSSCLSRLSSILQSDFQEMRALLESGQHVSEIKSLRSFFWSRSTSGNAWIMPPIVKFAGAVSSTEEHHTSVYRVLCRIKDCTPFFIFCSYFDIRLRHKAQESHPGRLRDNDCLLTRRHISGMEASLFKASERERCDQQQLYSSKGANDNSIMLALTPELTQV